MYRSKLTAGSVFGILVGVVGRLSRRVVKTCATAHKVALWDEILAVIMAYCRLL